MLCMDQKNFLNDHDQDNLFVISEVTNLGSYSSSHQGMCQAAPWEAVFYKQTDRDLYRKRWSETAGLYACTRWERLKKKQLSLVRGRAATTILAGWWSQHRIRQATVSASYQNLKHIVGFLKPTDFFLQWQMHRPHGQLKCNNTNLTCFSRHPRLRKSILKIANVFNTQMLQ